MDWFVVAFMTLGLVEASFPDWHSEMEWGRWRIKDFIPLTHVFKINRKLKSEELPKASAQIQEPGPTSNIIKNRKVSSRTSKLEGRTDNDEVF